MRKRIRNRVLAGILAVVLLAAVPETVYAVDLVEDGEKALDEDGILDTFEEITANSSGGFTPRTSEPDQRNKNDAEHYWNGNPYPKGPNYSINNCTKYAYGRAYELLGVKPNLQGHGNAQNWYGCAWDGYERSTNIREPRLGAIICWSGGTYGHVAVVEAIDGEWITFSDSSYPYDNKPGWNFRTNNKHVNDLAKYVGNFQGYIYLPGVGADQPPVDEEGSDMQAPFTRTIADGDYHIVTALDDSMCLDVAGASKEDGANVQIYHGTEDELQVFTVTWLGVNKGYKIIHRNSGKSLDVAGRSRTAGTNVWQWEYFDPSEHTQDWVINEVDNGAYYTIQSRGSGFYLDVDEGTAADETNVKIWKGNGGTAQKWRFIPAGTQTVANGDYYIATALDSGMCLNVQGASMNDEANVEIARKKEQDSQIFTVTYLNNGFYKILNKHSGKSLDVYIGNAVRGTNVQQYGYHGGLPQQWTIRRAENGTFYIQPRCSGHYLDVANGSTADGTNVWTTVWMGGAAAQRWVFVPVEKQRLAPPTSSVPSGSEVKSGTKVTLLVNESGAAVHYTLDGSNPTKASARYSAPIAIEKDITIKAMAVKEGFADSDTAVFTYTVKTAGTPEVPDDPETPDVPDRGEVLEEDVPQGRVENIPQGLWMSEIIPQTYTGKAIKPEVRVYDHKTRLVEKRDYTISYKNNVKANASSGKNLPTITVSGKGNYTGKETQTFDILPKQLADDDVTADSLTVSYTGKVQKPVPAVTWNGRKLTKNRDYKVIYPHAQQAGTYTIRLEGVGNYGGERPVTLTITQCRPVSVMKVDKVANQIYTGEEVRPALRVKDGRNVLTEGVDYEVSYQNNVKTGTASAMIVGKGKYAGTRRISFKIVQKASLNQAKAELTFKEPVVYTGKEVKPDGYKLTVSVKNADGNKEVVTLAEGTDFTVSYKNNIKPGTAAILFQGINGCTGTLKKTYKIGACDIGESTGTGGRIRIDLEESYPYAKGGCKPEPVVTFQGNVLKKGTDYTLNYRNNTVLNDGSDSEKLPVVIIRGKGCFTGAREAAYKITARDIGGLTMSASDKVWQNKKNIYRTKVVIRDVDGKALSAGRDYEKLLRYEYGAAVALPDGTVRMAGEEVSGNDILPAGTLLRVTASAKGTNYTGTVSCDYRITKADIGKAKVTIPAQTYTGREIRPDGEMQVKLNGRILSGDNYEITGYTNNINKGTATVTIKGKNDCGGVKTVKFRIKRKGFLWWWR